MSSSITIELPDEMLLRYQKGAVAARKNLETFMVERLGEVAPPLVDEPYSPIDDELAALEQADDKTLWKVAQSRLSTTKQHEYDDLLDKNSQGMLTDNEAALLHELGEEARQITLKRAHAYMLLRWRGHSIPTPNALAKLA